MCVCVLPSVCFVLGNFFHFIHFSTLEKNEQKAWSSSSRGDVLNATPHFSAFARPEREREREREDMRKFLASLAKPLVDALLQPNVSRFIINEIQKAASVRCHKYVYDYIAGGSDDESALRNNAEF